MPEHHLLTEEQAAEVLKELQVEKDKLPKIRMDDPAQRERETLGLRKIGDSFAKIVVRGGYMRPTFDDNGILHVGLIPFLLERKIMDDFLCG